METIRFCRMCKAPLVLGENWTQGASKNYSYRCRSCASEAGVQHYKKHAAKYAEMRRERIREPKAAEASAEYKSAYYAKNKDKWREVYQPRSRQKTKANPWHRSGALLTWARARAARKGMAFDLTREWLEARLTAGVCEATGMEFEYAEDEGVRFRPFMPSLDRIDSSRGYTQDNCRVVLWAYNMAKAEWSDDVVLRMAQALVGKNSPHNVGQ